MNKIYKSLYNAVRGTWVVVSEATSSYKQPSKSLLRGGDEGLLVKQTAKAKTIASAVMAACLMMGVANAWGAPEPEVGDAIYIGGIKFNALNINDEWQEVFSGRGSSSETNWAFNTSRTSFNGKYPYNDIDLSGAHWNSLADGGTGSFVHDTDKTVIIGSAHDGSVFNNLAVNGGKVTLENHHGILEICGNVSDLYENLHPAINSVAQSSGSTAEINNMGSGTIRIKPGYKYGIYQYSVAIDTVASLGGTASINNKSNGQIEILSALDRFGYTYAIEALASQGKGSIVNYDTGNILIDRGIGKIASGEGSVGIISNKGNGRLEYIFESRSIGAENYATGRLENLGSGEFILKGQCDAFAINNGEVYISNYGGTMSLASDGENVDEDGYPYMVHVGATKGGKLSIINYGGTLLLDNQKPSNGFDGSSIFTYLVKEMYITSVEEEFSGAKGQIINASAEKLEISSKPINQDQIHVPPVISYMTYVEGYDYEAKATAHSEITNIAGGDLVISGNKDAEEYAINTMLYLDLCVGSGCHSGGTSGGNKLGTDKNKTASALIKNAKGIMRLETNAIGNMFATVMSDTNLAKQEASSTIENHDVLYLAEGAIGSFGVGGKFINKAGATVKAEVEALFKTKPWGAFSISQEPKQTLKTIAILGKDGQTKSVTVEGYESQLGEQYPNDWSDTFGGIMSWNTGWNTNSIWEDGGHLVITDIAEGTTAADEIRSYFQKQFGTGTTISFKGGVTETAGVTDFVRSMLDTLIARGDVSNGSVLSDVTFSAGGGEFLVGTNGINQDIGFMGIKNASAIKVTDGKTLTLTGGVTNTRMAGEDIPIVLQNGTLQLGDTRLAAGEGIIGSIATDAHSSVDVAHGHFTLQNVTGNGHIEVGDQGNVTLNTFSTTVNNLGVLNTVGDVTINAVDKSKSKALQYAFRNQGIATLKGVTVSEGAELRNVKDGKVTAGAVKLNAGSELTNLGTMTVDSLTGWGTIRNKGTLNVSGQLFVPGQSTQYLAGTVNAGDLVIGQTDKPQESSLLVLNPMGILMVQGQTFAKKVSFNNGNINVTDGATFALGMNENDYKDFAKEHKDLVKDKTVLVVDKSFDFGENDSLWVGQDKSDKNLALGEKSLVVLTAENLKGQAMFDAKDGATLSADIAEGAQFVFEGNMLGRHYIAKGFDEASNKAFESLTITNLKDNQVMDVGSNANGVFVINGTDNIATIAPDALFKDAFNHVLNAHQDTESKNAMVAWISKLISQKDVTNATLTQATMSLAQTAALAGVEQQGLAHGLTMADELKADHAKDGLLWANVLHTKSDVSGLDLGNGLEADYDVKGNGLVVGAELPLSNSLALGTAVSYQKAKVEATGLQNEAETVAGSIYAKERVGAFNFMQSVTVAKTNHEVKGFNSTDVDTQALVLDLEGAYTHELSQGFAVQPYAGLRASMLKVDDSTIAMGGHDVVKHEGDTDTFIQMPVGVKLQKAMETSGGWRVMGEAKLGAVTTLGNTEANSKVSAIGFTGTDSLETQVLDRTVGDFGINVMAGNKTVQMGVGYNFQGSSSVKDHQLKANLKFVF